MGNVIRHQTHAVFCLLNSPKQNCSNTYAGVRLFEKERGLISRTAVGNRAYFSYWVRVESKGGFPLSGMFYVRAHVNLARV